MPIYSIQRFCAIAVLAVFSNSASAAKKPNILFAFADDWGRHAGAYGTPWVKTPTFDKLSEQGICYTQAYTATAKCAPSRASVLTGRYCWQNEEIGNHLAYWPKDRYTSYIETLVKNGYYAGRVGKGWAPGILPQGRKIAGEFYHKKNGYVAAFKRFLDDVPEGKPFHFWFCSSDPHRSYVRQKHSAQKLASIQLPSYWPDNRAVRQDVADYTFEVERFDRHTGEMIEILKQRGLLENTIVIMSSDHGMPFPRAKGDTYLTGNHVPLAIAWKGIKNPGRQSKAFVNLIDIAPTIFELAGIQPEKSTMKSITGRSLSDTFRATSEQLDETRSYALYGRERHDIKIRPRDTSYPSRAIRTEKYLFIHNFKPNRIPTTIKESGGRIIIQRMDKKSAEWKLHYARRPEFELYDVQKDAECVHNLASDPKLATVLKTLKSQLHSALKQQGDPRMFGKGDAFDTYPPVKNWMKAHHQRDAQEAARAK